MINRINEWLQDPSRNFSEGVKLYDQNKISGKFDNFFRVQNPGLDSMQYKMLIAELRKMLRKLRNQQDNNEQHPAESKFTKEITAAPLDLSALKIKTVKKNPIITDNNRVDVSKLSTEMQDLYFENKKLYAKIQTLHNNLKHASSDEERKGIREEMDIADDVHKENWAKIDAWYLNSQQTTDDSPQKKKEPDDPIKQVLELTKRRDNLRSNISRTETNLDQMKDKFKKKNQEKLIEWKKELGLVIEKLKSLEGAKSGDISEQ